ncbi:MAG: hypothetical protein PHV37_08595 [Candidatus Gastranaerophilales bacterium]|nr:hypothetical protein [Candidatus Gastranaerophilales bacterium]
MDDLLTKFGFNSSTVVGVSISSNNLVEMICIDKNNHSISQYAARELKYNNAIREIVDYEELYADLVEMFRELGLNPKSCKVILNMPNVHFGFIHLPLILPDDQVSSAIISEVEQLYLFKRNDPIVSWNTVDQSAEQDKRYIVYSAIQEDTIQNVKEVFDRLGSKLIVIENSHSSMIKGVQYSKILDAEMSTGAQLNMLLITANSYAIFCMNGNQLIDYYEEPLAIKSFTGDEVYLAIASAASSTLEHYPTRNLLIVSETNDVSAELLSTKINFEGDVKYLDRNKYTDKSFINIDFAVLQTYTPLITLEAVGTAAYNYEPYPIKFNFLEDAGVLDTVTPLTINLFGKDIDIDRKAIGLIFGAAAAVIIIFFVLIALLFNTLDSNIKKDLTELTQQETQLKDKVGQSGMNANKADIFTVSQQIFNENKHEFTLYNALSTDIPKDAWVEYFATNSDGEVTIQGKSAGSDSIYTFFRGLKNANPDVYISQLQTDLNSNAAVPDITATNGLYTFEIKSSKNKPNSSTSPVTPSTQQDSNNKDGQPNNAEKLGIPNSAAAPDLPPVPAPNDSVSHKAAKTMMAPMNSANKVKRDTQNKVDSSRRQNKEFMNGR